MILLDTDALSAVMQANPPEVVIAWLDRQFEGVCPLVDPWADA